jgi:chromosome partitioning protein
VIDVTSLDNLHKIVVINPKGGCGKSTLVTNLASAYAQKGMKLTLVDCDPHGFALRWLEKRPAGRPPIFGVEAYDISDYSASPVGTRIPAESDVVIFDLPAAVTAEQVHKFTYIADRILIPIMPSAVDVYSATRFIAELLLHQQLDRQGKKLAIVANRIRSNTKSYQMLKRFLSSLKIPVIAEFRDSQNFVYAIANGIGICELPAYRTKADISQIAALMSWLLPDQQVPQQKQMTDEQRDDQRQLMTDEQRMSLVAQEAYRRAEDRGFAGGDQSSDWLDAERTVDELYGEKTHR